MNAMDVDKELYRRVDEVIHYLWDPIGVSGSPQARDEYHAYLSGMVDRVRAGNSDAIVEYMQWVVSERMGLAFDQQGAAKAAEALLDWRNFLEEA